MKKIIIILATVVAAASFTACNKFLDVMPDNRTEINTLEKAKALLVSAYPSKEYASFLEYRCDGIIDHGSCMEGTQQDIQFECTRIAFNWDEYPSIETDIDQEAYWSACYEAIAAANAALETIEKLPAEEQADALPYKSEALLCRAYCHFQLLTLFSNFFDENGRDTNMGIPYVTESETVINKQYERETVAKTFAKIKADYAEGMKYAGTTSDFNQPKFHFGVDAGRMLGLRIALYERNYPEVISLASQLIPQPTDITTVSSSIPVTIPKSTDPAWIFCQTKMFNWVTASTAYSSVDGFTLAWSKATNPNLILMSEPYSLLQRLSYSTYYTRYAYSAKEFGNILSNNPTGYSYRYPTFGLTIARSTDPSLLPKIHEDFKVTNISANTGQPYVRFPLFRLEEALLARAEAYTMTGEYEKAMWDLFMYSQNRIKATYPEGFWDADSIIDYYYYGSYDVTKLFVDNEFNSGRFTAAKDTDEGMLQRGLLMSILDVRRAEFIFEGMRYFDILRWNIPVTHKNKDGQSSTLTPDDNRRVLQIPATTELSGLEKNPYTTNNPWM